jgi:hypothetical protein
MRYRYAQLQRRYCDAILLQIHFTQEESMVSFTKVRSTVHLQIPVAYWLFTGVWLSGLILGTIFSAIAGNHYFLLMRMAPQSHVSIVGLAVTVLLPFLLSAFAVYKDRPWMLHLICSTKVFTFAFCGFGITAAYGGAGWLVRLLLQFSDICTVPILCWFALRHLTGKRIGWKRDIGICLGLAVAVCCLDLWYISPFLALITKN